MARGSGTGVTIGDVADAAAVSIATASRAMNDSPLVAPATKERVREAAARIGYVPNAQGRALAVGRAESIAILVTEPLDELFQDPTYAALLRGVVDGLADTPMLPVLLQAWSDAEHERALRQFERRSVDAVISISPYVGRDMLDALREGPLPVVLCGQLQGQPYADIFSSVYSDDVAGARLAGARMAASARRRIAVVNGPRENPASADRLVGYREALGDLFAPELAVWTGWDSTSGFDAMRRLLEIEPGIDGVLAASDRIAVGAIAALETVGRQVPRDVSMIGFDDHAIAATSRPPLTTVRQPLREEGRVAAELALTMLDGAPPRTVVLDMELIERESC